jgi:hypothetical protein
MKINILIFILLASTSILSAQVDTIVYDDGSFCLYDKSYRPAHFNSFPFMKQALHYDTLNKVWRRNNN